MTPTLSPDAVHDPQTRQTIVRLLSSMASPKEISQYLKRFSQRDAARFAVVKVGGAVLRDDLDALVSSLAFLQDVGLTPIVIHGAGPQLDAELSAAGIEKKTIDGLRVTSPEALAIVRHGTAGFGVSIDLDAPDPAEAPGTGLPVPGGLGRVELATALTRCEYQWPEPFPAEPR